MATYLEFERPIAEMTAKIEELSLMGDDAKVNIADEVERLNAKRDALVKRTYDNASRSEVAQLSRHPDRPNLLDYIPLIFDDFQELHGDYQLLIQTIG